MDEAIFQKMAKRYAPLISSIIESDVRFYRFNKTIRWRFCYDERVAIFGSYNEKDDILSINI